MLQTASDKVTASITNVIQEQRTSHITCRVCSTTFSLSLSFHVDHYLLTRADNQAVLTSGSNCPGARTGYKDLCEYHLNKLSDITTAIESSKFGAGKISGLSDGTCFICEIYTDLDYLMKFYNRYNEVDGIRILRPCIFSDDIDEGHREYLYGIMSQRSMVAEEIKQFGRLADAQAAALSVMTLIEREAEAHGLFDNESSTSFNNGHLYHALSREARRLGEADLSEVRPKPFDWKQMLAAQEEREKKAKVKAELPWTPNEFRYPPDQF